MILIIVGVVSVWLLWEWWKRKCDRDLRKEVEEIIRANRKPKWLQQISCQHKFDYKDLVNRKTPYGNVKMALLEMREGF